jgi:chaperonin GroEL
MVRLSLEERSALEDLAVFTGATLIDKDNDMTMRESLPTYLGAAEKVIVKRNSTFIIGGKSDTKKLEDLISSVNTQIGEATDSEIKKRLKERLARLKGGASTIYIGGNSASEINQKKDRIDDAIAATRASLEEGFIVGGGVGYLKAAKYLRETDFSSYVEENFKSQTEDFNLGIKLLIDALEKPFKILCQNSEIEPDVLIQNIVDNKQDFNYGYNFLKDEYCDLYETGVIDPYKVTRCALENSVSVFNLILTTDCLVVDDNDDLI